MNVSFLCNQQRTSDKTSNTGHELVFLVISLWRVSKVRMGDKRTFLPKDDSIFTNWQCYFTIGLLDKRSGKVITSFFLPFLLCEYVILDQTNAPLHWTRTTKTMNAGHQRTKTQKKTTDDRPHINIRFTSGDHCDIGEWHLTVYRDRQKQYYITKISGGREYRGRGLDYKTSSTNACWLFPRLPLMYFWVIEFPNEWYMFMHIENAWLGYIWFPWIKKYF